LSHLQLNQVDHSRHFKATFGGDEVSHSFIPGSEVYLLLVP